MHYFTWAVSRKQTYTFGLILDGYKEAKFATPKCASQA